MRLFTPLLIVGFFVGNTANAFATHMNEYFYMSTTEVVAAEDQKASAKLSFFKNLEPVDADELPRMTDQPGIKPLSVKLYNGRKSMDFAANNKIFGQLMNALSDASELTQAGKNTVEEYKASDSWRNLTSAITTATKNILTKYRIILVDEFPAELSLFNTSRKELKILALQRELQSTDYEFYAVVSAKSIEESLAGNLESEVDLYKLLVDEARKEIAVQSTAQKQVNSFLKNNPVFSTKSIVFSSESKNHTLSPVQKWNILRKLKEAVEFGMIDTSYLYEFIQRIKNTNGHLEIRFGDERLFNLHRQNIISVSDTWIDQGFGFLYIEKTSDSSSSNESNKGIIEYLEKSILSEMDLMDYSRAHRGKQIKINLNECLDEDTSVQTHLSFVCLDKSISECSRKITEINHEEKSALLNYAIQTVYIGTNSALEDHAMLDDGSISSMNNWDYLKRFPMNKMNEDAQVIEDPFSLFKLGINQSEITTEMIKRVTSEGFRNRSRCSMAEVERFFNKLF
ncbi:MAG: hypothetical protein AB8E15_02155 [Bdellovibrionales bacterium]